MNATAKNQKYMLTQQKRNCFRIRCFSSNDIVGQCSHLWTQRAPMEASETLLGLQHAQGVAGWRDAATYREGGCDRFEQLHLHNVKQNAEHRTLQEDVRPPVAAHSCGAHVEAIHKVPA